MANRLQHGVDPACDMRIRALVPRLFLEVEELVGSAVAPQRLFKLLEGERRYLLDAHEGDRVSEAAGFTLFDQVIV